MKFVLKVNVIALLFIASRLISFADEGMWLPQLLQSLNEKDMKRLGMKISAADIYNVNKGSLKDAIVSLNGGSCTAEIISEQGLLLTNHHCGFDEIQSHSSLQNNYIRDGFWAKTINQELQNPSMFATFIISINEVSDIILKGVTPSMTESQRQSMIDKNIAAAKNSIPKEAHQELLIRPLFDGNKYFVFVTETYRDIRLVGAPPSSIGNFGKDTDNWMWPRHTGDFSLFRIYAGRNNKPAPYSSDNVPYKPKRSLKISLSGLNENDFTMIFGFPGATTQYLHSAAVKMIMNVTDPAKVGIRHEALDIIGRYMRADENIKIQYASKYAGIENSYKKWKGEILGLRSTNAVDKKKKYEAEFTKRISANPAWAAKYGTLLADLEKIYAEIEPYAFARDYNTEISNPIELLTVANDLNKLASTFRNNGAAQFAEDKEELRKELITFYKDYNANIDRELFQTLMSKYVQDQNPPLYFCTVPGQS